MKIALQETNKTLLLNLFCAIKHAQAFEVFQRILFLFLFLNLLFISIFFLTSIFNDNNYFNLFWSSQIRFTFVGWLFLKKRIKSRKKNKFSARYASDLVRGKTKAPIIQQPLKFKRNLLKITKTKNKRKRRKEKLFEWFSSGVKWISWHRNWLLLRMNFFFQLNWTGFFFNHMRCDLFLFLLATKHY